MPGTGKLIVGYILLAIGGLIISGVAIGASTKSSAGDCEATGFSAKCGPFGSEISPWAVAMPGIMLAGIGLPLVIVGHKQQARTQDRHDTPSAPDRTQ